MGSLAADEDEHLEDGCSVATPDGDNLVMDHARAEAAAYGAAAASVGGRLHDDDVAGLHLRDTGAPSPFGNAALLTLPVGEDDGDALAEHLLDFYRQQSGGPFLVMSPWRTPDWSGHGFRRVGHPPLMYRPPGPPSPSTAPESGIEVVEVVGDEMLAAFEATLIEAYPVPEMQPARRNSLLGPSILESDWTLLAGRVDGRVVATVPPTVRRASRWSSSSRPGRRPGAGESAQP